MEDGRLQITVVSANDLEYVNVFSKMDVYVIVSINGDSRSKQTTPVHRKGGTSPSWNSPMEFTFNNAAAQLNQLTLSLKIRCERVLGDKDIGEVCVPIKDLLQQAGGSNGMLSVTLPVKRPSGRHKGDLTFSYKFGHHSASPSAPERQAPGLPDTPDAPVPGAPDVGNPPPPPVAVPIAPVWANPPPAVAVPSEPVWANPPPPPPPPPPVAVPSAPVWGNPPPPPPPPPPYTYAPLPWYTPAAQPPDRTYRLQQRVQQAHLALTASGLFWGPSTGADDWADDDFGLGLLGL